MKKIVIVGAGYAGVLTAKKLARKLKKNDDVSITIVDKIPFHTMLTELHEVAAKRVDEDGIRVSLKKIFAGRKVDVKLDTITSFDFENKRAIGKADSYDYDYLVLSAGSKPTFFGVPGAEEHAFKFWSYEDAVAIRHRLVNLFQKACAVADREERAKLLSIYVIGAGFTGVELAGEIAEYIPIICGKFEIDREDVKISVVDVLDRTVPNLPEKLSAKVEKRLKKMGVSTVLGANVCRIGEDFIEIRQNGACIRHQANTVIWAAGIESADITGEAAKVLESANRGRIRTDPYLRSLNDPSVFVIGDNMLYTPEGTEHPVPQIVENAEQSAKHAAHNIACLITGKGELKKYEPKFHGFMVCVGGRYGVARVGIPNFMINLPSFFAMAAKHFINIVYFVQVLGWNKVYSYLKHEFFTIRDKRSFLGGHFSNRTPSFLLVPFRMWLGAVWLYEGIMKIVGGWMKTPKLEGFFGSAAAWFESLLGTGGADAVSSATAQGEAAAESAGTVIFNLNILGLFRTIFVSGKTLAESTVADYAFKLDIPLLNRFIERLVIPNDWLQLLMQIFIVLAEIVIGLSLIGGLFSTPSSALSIILLLMFTSTTGLYLSSFWMVFGAIALLFGAGSIFGFDYYTTPLLKKLWRRLPWVRSRYIYHD